MPFTIDGQWVPSKHQPSENKSGRNPVKVRLIKRGKSVLTVVLNLSMEQEKMVDLASDIKKKLGCGGAVKEDMIEIQGDKVEQIKKILADKGIKSS